MPSEFQSQFSQSLEGGLQQLTLRDQRRALAEFTGVNLCSNDYLGLAQSAALREALLEAVASASRVGSTGSRLLSGHAAAWEDLENEFAQFAATEAALYFTSGYAANIGLITSFAGPSDLIFSDALNHASLIDGIRLSGAQKFIYAHLDLDMLESFLREHQHENGRKFVVTETVFSMDGDIAPLAEILALADRYHAGVILDEAHATAVHGPQGRGIAAWHHTQHGNSGNIVAVVHTCGKALASAGAFVCGSEMLKQYLINHARTFIFTTALPPYMAAQIRTALRLAQGMDEQRSRLLRNSESLRASLGVQGWDIASSKAQIIPVVIGKNESALSAASILRQEGFATRAIRPPTVPQGTARLRFSLTASISPSELSRLTACMRQMSNDFRDAHCGSAPMQSAGTEHDAHESRKAAGTAVGH
jgi:8-amino-7-oxononanoate synthase